MSHDNSQPPQAKLEQTSPTFKITFQPLGQTIQVDPARASRDRAGLPGSILELSKPLEPELEIEHTCGGVGACATCHVRVLEGLESCGEPSENELDMLDNAPDATDQSRLACQCVPSGAQDLVVEIPAWNRNAVGETPH